MNPSVFSLVAHASHNSTNHPYLHKGHEDNTKFPGEKCNVFFYLQNLCLCMAEISINFHHHQVEKKSTVHTFLLYFSMSVFLY